MFTRVFYVILVFVCLVSFRAQAIVPCSADLTAGDRLITTALLWNTHPGVPKELLEFYVYGKGAMSERERLRLESEILALMIIDNPGVPHLDVSGTVDISAKMPRDRFRDAVFDARTRSGNLKSVEVILPVELFNRFEQARGTFGLTQRQLLESCFQFFTQSHMLLSPHHLREMANRNGIRYRYADTPKIITIKLDIDVSSELDSVGLDRKIKTVQTRALAVSYALEILSK